MNRRSFCQTATAAAVATAVDLGWITIAHLGTNRAGRTYTEEHLAVIERDVKRSTKVVEWYHDEPPTLDQLYGVVTETRRHQGEFQVKVHWFKPPKGKSWLSIHGSMQAHGKLDGTEGFTIIEVYHLEPSSAGSNFQHATAI